MKKINLTLIIMTIICALLSAGCFDEAKNDVAFSGSLSELLKECSNLSETGLKNKYLNKKIEIYCGHNDYNIIPSNRAGGRGDVIRASITDDKSIYLQCFRLLKSHESVKQFKTNVGIKFTGNVERIDVEKSLNNNAKHILIFIGDKFDNGNKSSNTSNNKSTVTKNNTYSSIYMGAISSAYESSADKEGNYVHSAKLAIDGNITTCWTEGVQGLGIGERIVYNFNDTYQVRGFDIWVGHQKSSDLFYKNARPTRIKVEGNNGQTAIVNLSDTLGSQRVTLSTPMNTNSISITIQDANSGSKWQDTSIAEISFF